MTPYNKIKREILWQCIANGDFRHDGPLGTNEQVEAAYDSLGEVVEISDTENEFRSGKFKTDLPCECNRNYESESVAVQLSDDTWVGWTHFFGGGKHGDPESIDWMEDAYELTCVEEEKLVVVRTFAKVEPEGGDE